MRLAGHLWDLTSWLPGTATYDRQPSHEKLASAMSSLARFHEAARDASSQRNDYSPGIRYRLQRIDDWMSGRLTELTEAIQGQPISWLEPIGMRLVELFRVHAPSAIPMLRHSSEPLVPISPCIRDIWHDHVLYTEDQVTGIIDFGAMREDNVSGDIARLLGSLVKDDSDAWARGLAAYQTVRPLSAVESEMIRAFDLGNVLLSGLNWLQWLYLDHRSFEATETIRKRLNDWADRMASVPIRSISQS